MPAFITATIAFLKSHWSDLLEIGAFTTAVNQLVQRLVAPKFPRFGNIVNTVTVDFLALLAELGGALNIGPRAAKKAAGSALVMLALVVGCQAVAPVVDGICTVLAIGDEALLEQYAASQGLSVAVVRAIYIAACGPLSGDKSAAQAAGRNAAMHAKALMQTDGGAP